MQPVTFYPYEQAIDKMARPAIQTVYGDQQEIMHNYLWFMSELNKTRLGNTHLHMIPYLLDMHPMVEVPVVRTRYVRRGMVREAYMLQWSGVNPDKVWPLMAEHQNREQITSAIHLMSRVNSSEHEGLHSAYQSWVKDNQ